VVAQVVPPGADRSFQIRRVEGARQTFDVVTAGLAGASLRFQVVRTDRNKLRLTLIGDDGVLPTDEDVTMWSTAVTAALAGLKRDLDEFVWSGFLGPDVGKWLTQAQRLGGPTAVGPFRLVPAPDAYGEIITKPRGGAVGITHSWFIRVEGVVKARDNWEAEGIAASHARTVSALLSLAWGTDWVLRMGPFTARVDERPEFVFPNTSAWVEDNPLNGGSSAPPNKVDLPDWLGKAWAIAERDQEISRILHVYHEARALDPSHPSFAALGYIATIEGIAGRRFPQIQSCKDCNQKTGSAARFRRMVKEVLYRDEAERISTAYDRRSRTVHTGELFGYERNYGHSPLGAPPSENDATRFTRDTLLSLQRAARRLVIRELGGPLNWEPLTKEDMPGGLLAAAMVI
jgi:hypothetical protein